MTRDDLVDELERLRAEHSREMGVLTKAEQKAAAAVEKARKPYETAVRGMREAGEAASLARARFDHRVRRIEGELVRTAPEDIGVFTAEANALLESVRLSVRGPSERAEQITARARAAISEALSLTLRPERLVLARLAELRADLLSPRLEK